MDDNKKSLDTKNRQKRLKPITVILLLMVILIAGASLRMMNTNWDDSQHLHPDERFLSQVIAQIRPVSSISEYFDTEHSLLNPNTHGHTFFVYGTFPLFIIRYVGEWTGQIGYDLNTLIGRQLSATSEIFTILIVFMIGFKLYNQRAALIAAALYAFAVLPIQQAHFMTVDTFTNTFGMLTVLAAVYILKQELAERELTGIRGLWIRNSAYLFFGIALGMATASKINAVSLALLLPLVELVRFNREEDFKVGKSILKMAFAGVISFLTFRVLQPYAFTGPGFFNLAINQDWWMGLRNLQTMSTGEVDFPPALQWIRRPSSFAFSNLMIWGVGLPWGVASVISWIAQVWQIIKRRKFDHAPICLWMLLYFLWQGLAWVSSMRYLLLLYPLMAVITAWGLEQLISRREELRIAKFKHSSLIISRVGIFVTALVLLSTALWAFAFTRIYTEPVTRVQTSEWIYENLEAPINLKMETEAGEESIPAQYRAYTVLFSGQELPLVFSTPVSAYLMELNYPMVQQIATSADLIEYQLDIIDLERGQALNQTPFIASNPMAADGLSRQAVLNFNFNQTIHFEAGKFYKFVLTMNTPESQAYVSGVPTLGLYREDGQVLREVLPKIDEQINLMHPYSMSISVLKTGQITAVELPMVLDHAMNPKDKTLRLMLTSHNYGNSETVSSLVKAKLNDPGDGRGQRLRFEFEKPLIIEHPQVIDLFLGLDAGEGAIMVATPGMTFESSWDDALPLPLMGYSPFQPDGSGFYRPDLKLEVYWNDDANKLERFYQILNQTDYIVMSSNRQFGTIPRAPEKYPMTTHFYRELLNCPDDMDTLVCYYEAEAENINPEFGFDLIKTFTSYPRLGDWEFNDQYAEEAFSVYDHPKVLIFRKNEHFDSERLLKTLNEVDVSKALPLTPKQMDEYKPQSQSGNSDLMLTDEEVAVQQAGGTWSALFNRESVLNNWPWLGVVSLYLFFLALGWVVFPIVMLAFPGLNDKGYAFARIVGLLSFALFAFNLGSLKIEVTRNLLIYVLLAIAIISIVVAGFNRKKLQEEIKDRWKLILTEEIVFLVAFLFFLWIRYNNPDLWHPWRGGEKPMDFSYLNAVIKSSTFPAYDPWFAGGFINYYYYGQVLVALPIKLLGIIPAVAYNICLALWYAMLVAAVFSIGWNLTWFVYSRKNSETEAAPASILPFWGGIASCLLLALLGNLGTIKVLSDGLAILGSKGADITQTNFFQYISWAIQGIASLKSGAQLPIGAGSWYWNPSRTIPGEPITEFPFFTFLYADFHAHLIAMPIVLAAIGWGLSLVMAKWKGGLDWKKLISAAVPILFVGAMVVGALQPTNTWDYITFAVFNLVVLGYVSWRELPAIKGEKLPKFVRKAILPGIGVLIFVGSSRLLYYQFNHNFFPGYNSVGFWEGPRTPIWSYLLHWGLILFLIAWWFAWELYQWLAATRLSQLPEWMKKKHVLIGFAAGIGTLLIALLILKVKIALIAVPLATLALFLLIITKNDAKRLAFFMIGTGLLLTIVVELVYLVGDVGRMNVVFKLYHQAWMLLTLPLGLALVTLIKDMPTWRPSRQYLFQIPLFILVFIALLFPVLASQDKMSDRMSPTAPKTLDGMKYVETSVYNMNGIDMDLAQDYRAIQWLQDHVEGSPVIVEAQAYEYRWGNRFTIYTGLPGVVGWNYHQRQQRAILQDNSVQNLVDEVNAFYESGDQEFVKDFLERYHVKYIIVGQQEVAMYSYAGLDKFLAWDGLLWKEVYRDAGTAIYEVIQND